LPFTYSSAAPNHFAKRLIGMQWEESPLPSCPPDQLGLCICPQLWRGPQAATSSVSRVFDRLGSRQIDGKSPSFAPGVVKWINYTFCTGRVLLLPLPGNTRSSGACKHFEFGVAPQIARFRRLRALGLIGKLGSPAITGPKDGFCSGQITPSERC